MRTCILFGARLAVGSFISVHVAHAGLGDMERDIDQDRVRLHAQRSVDHRYPYRVHALQTSDGSRFWQYVGLHGRVFAVTWQAMHKPDISQLLGDASAGYVRATAQAATHGGIQRQFQHQETDVVVQSNAYLHKFAGVAYRPSLVPVGFDLAKLGRE